MLVYLIKCKMSLFCIFSAALCLHFLWGNAPLQEASLLFAKYSYDSLFNVYDYMSAQSFTVSTLVL